ncbi:TPA: antitoxin [Streptococcus suis]|nr:antitoxin [Streptococcus suis]HEM3626018.1 antitoxin [Streptococcus suis]HEM3630352.1 antitoxin [Streptococcus suis]HEM3643827.1 antitoxin [Streptococcus suis]
MNKKGRPAGVKNERGLYTVAIPKEVYDQIDDLAIGSGMSRTAVASLLFKKGLEGIQIIEETITRKRIVGIE